MPTSFELLAIGIATMAPTHETALQAQRTVDEYHRRNDITTEERRDLRFQIEQALRNRATADFSR